jgi:hypothetical protein
VVSVAKSQVKITDMRVFKQKKEGVCTKKDDPLFIVDTEPKVEVTKGQNQQEFCVAVGDGDYAKCNLMLHAK